METSEQHHFHWINQGAQAYISNIDIFMASYCNSITNLITTVSKLTTQVSDTNNLLSTYLSSVSHLCLCLSVSPKTINPPDIIMSQAPWLTEKKTLTLTVTVGCTDIKCISDTHPIPVKMDESTTQG